MAVTLSTEDKLEYNFYPVSGSQLQFRIKAPNDAHIALTTGPHEGEPMYEVFIGGWSNAKSVIRKNRTKPDVAETDTAAILSPDEFRGFWIRWSGGSLTVGKEGEADPFLSYDDPEPFQITHFGVCTGWGACGEWLLEANNPLPSAPSAVALGTECWCDASNGVIPPGAVEGGSDEEPLYVGRAQHEGALIPGKIKASHGVCYVAWGGMENAKTEYQVLCGCNPVWIPAQNGDIPPNAIPGGETEDGETLYIGRAPYEGTVTIGKVQQSHGVLYIPFGGEEISIPEYEILVNPM